MIIHFSRNTSLYATRISDIFGYKRTTNYCSANGTLGMLFNFNDDECV